MSQQSERRMELQYKQLVNRDCKREIAAVNLRLQRLQLPQNEYKAIPKIKVA